MNKVHNCKIKKNGNGVVYSYTSKNKALLPTDYNSGSHDYSRDNLLRGMMHFFEISNIEGTYEEKTAIVESRIPEFEFEVLPSVGAKEKVLGDMGIFE